MTRRLFDFMHKKCVGILHDARQALGTRQRGGQRGEGGEGGEGGGWKPTKAPAKGKGGNALKQTGAQRRVPQPRQKEVAAAAAAAQFRGLRGLGSGPCVPVKGSLKEPKGVWALGLNSAIAHIIPTNNRTVTLRLFPCMLLIVEVRGLLGHNARECE
jgi:hypothetical protein